MKTFLSFLFLCLETLTLTAQTPVWAWAKGVGSNIGQTYYATNSTYGWGVTTDNSGNVYSTGSFDDASLAIGSNTLTNANSSGAMPEFFVVKHDPLGNVLWAINAKGDSSDIATGIAKDDAGNIYVTGDFASPILTIGTLTLTNTQNGTTDLFLIKLNPNGQVIWGKSYGGISDENGIGLAINSNNEVCLTGNFMSQTFNIGSSTINIDSVGNQNMYLAKFDSSGAPIFAFSIGPMCNIPVSSSDIVCAPNNDIYLTGTFRKSPLVLGTDTLYGGNVSYRNFFICKYNSFGNLLWARSGHGTNCDIAINSLALDLAGNIFGVGNLSGSNYIIGKDTLTANCCYTGFIVKYTTSGQPLWAVDTKVNNPQPWPLSSIGVDSNYGVHQWRLFQSS